ncbi:hypothetical protein HF576_02005 [Microbacterium sp. CFH 90308]|uniref:Uncharacterized protein n=1 Tax=Microbacterium salsuginis TaxID=2722803 RepID=A0ABX1K9E9_9MICO|nr:hypothetical protein [Microbacterium sp. CFH 90308]NLP82613.1 hypothetical protein [Microbacterium sp. CFH 90308]
MSTPAPITPIRPDQPARQSDAIMQRLIERRATIKADQEILAGELEAIDGQLIELLGGEVGTHEIAGTKVEIREYSRTDYAALEKKYPAAEYPQLYTTKASLNQDVVKRQFAPAALDAFKVRGKKSVVVK